jgi:putative nucleotidyltransferase with HDIG domain
MRLKLHAEFPARFSDEIITAYFSVPDRSMFREYGERLLSGLFARGIFDLDAVDLGGYNPDMVELLLFYGDRTERERVSFGSITSLANVGEAITRAAAAEDMPQSFKSIASGLLRPFVSANVLFSREDTELRVAEVVERVTPVEIRIEEGERVIRRGFVITADEMRNLEELSASFPRQNPRNIVGHVVMLAMLYVLFILLQDRVVIGRDLSSGERSLLFVLVFLNMACAGLVQNIAPSMGNVPVALIFPTALFVMIPAAFMGSMMALAMALALPLSACLAGFFDVPSYVFALTSGVAASSVLRRAEKRMDIINASLIIAAVNCLATLVILLMRAATFAEYPMMLFWAALNGIVSGMLFLGVLAPLEHALNAPTAFRLIELSDLNAPTLRKLFTTAPGTYSHSVMVATLAEQACQDIGANALLARVGAYYHDIGKMDNPDYFVENQTDHNRHDDIAPRLSATVIRSHVKLGVEKARSLGLPEDIINIVSEHHGNSLITWFYNKATEQEEQVHSEDFAYPGSPPRSRESAVVMLADVTEAAVRTLVKPTAAKMEKFIQQLFDAKVEHGQLSQSELTFRDLETIKNAFVKVLAGYYHSRIEYPKENA